jgi:hypothetical protein
MANAQTARCPDNSVALLPFALLAVARQATSGFLAAPFNIARAQYSAAVQLGFVRRSMLDGRAVEQSLAALERLSLGVLARRV